jgi:type IV secretory pathway VirB2 component (pilin)
MSSARRALAVLPTLLLAAQARAYAATGGTDLPFNTPLRTVVDNLTGPTAHIIGIALLAAAGIMIGVAQHHEGWKFAAKVMVGIAVLFNAPGLISILGFGGAVV